MFVRTQSGFFKQKPHKSAGNGQSQLALEPMEVDPSSRSKQTTRW